MGVTAATIRDTNRGKHMEKVNGIGGFFFRAKDPESLGRWYQEHLGINPVPTEEGQQPWSQEAGTTAFAAFPQDTEYFGSAEKMWMINFRVTNLEAMVTQLQAAGIEVSVDGEPSPFGRFARLHDPEGNPIELWEP